MLLELLARRNRANATRILKDGVKVTARAIKSSPQIVKPIMRVGGQAALRTAGLSVGESVEAVAVGETAGTTGGGGAVLFGLSAGELLVVAAVIVFVLYLLYSWSQMDPKERGYGSTFDNSEAKRELAAMGEEGPIGGLQRCLGLRGLPMWMKGIAVQV
jgi:hypothetical protein